MEEVDHVHRSVWQVAAPGGGHWKFCSCGRTYLHSKWNTLDEAYRISNGDWRDWVGKFLRRHQTVISNTRQEVVDILIAWAQDTQSVSGTVRDNFTIWLKQYWNLPSAPVVITATEIVRLKYREMSQEESHRTEGCYRTHDGRSWEPIPGGKYRQFDPNVVRTENSDGSITFTKTAGDFSVIDGEVTFYSLSKEHHVNFLVHTQRIKAGTVGQLLDGSLAGEVLWESEPFEDQVDDDHKVTATAAEQAIAAAEEKLASVKKALFA